MRRLVKALLVLLLLPALVSGQVTVTSNGGAVDVTANYTWTGTNIWTIAVQPQAGVDCNINSATACKFTNTFGGSSLTFSNGSNVTLAAGAGGDIILQTLNGLTAQRTYIRRTGKVLSNTSATTQTFLQVSDATAHITASGTIEFGIRITDGTNDQALSGIIRWSYANTTAGAGGEFCGAAVIGTVDATAANGGIASSGTASATATTSTGTDLCNIQITPTFSLAPTVVEIYYTVFSQSKSATITPQ